MDSMGWRFAGACRDGDPDLHFPAGTSGPAVELQIAKAKAVCADCPVLVQCREAGMSEPYGIWGGLAEDERAILREQAAELGVKFARRGVVQVEVERLDGAQARERFFGLLAELQAGGAVEFRVADFGEFVGQVRSRAWVNAQLERLVAVGVLEKTMYRDPVAHTARAVYAFRGEVREVAA